MKIRPNKPASDVGAPTAHVTGDRGPTLDKEPRLVGEPSDQAVRLQREWMRMCRNLSDATGEVGCSTLLERAIKQTEMAHPASKDLRMGSSGRQRGVIEAVESHGIAAVEAAVAALTKELIGILARLIGEDMAIRIINPGNVRSAAEDTRGTP